MPPLWLDLVNNASWTLEEILLLAVPSHYKVVVVTHTTDRLDDFTFVVGNDFNSLEVLICGVNNEDWGSLALFNRL